MAITKTINLAPTSEENTTYESSGSVSTRAFKILRQKVDLQGNNLQAEITTLGGEIDLRVLKTDYNGSQIVSYINLQPDTVKIAAKNVEISGTVALKSNLTDGVTTISGNNITTGALNANLITTGTLSADRIYGGTINGNVVNVTNLNAGNITGGTISADRINAGYLSAGTIGGWNIGSSTLSRANITLGSDVISLGSATGTGAATINFHGGAVKLYNNASSTSIGVSGNMIVDSNLYVLGTAIVDDIRPSTSGISLGASGYRWGQIYADGLWCNTVGSSTTASERPNVYAGTVGATFGGTFYYLTRDANGFVKAV